MAPATWRTMELILTIVPFVAAALLAVMVLGSIAQLFLDR